MIEICAFPYAFIVAYKLLLVNFILMMEAMIYSWFVIASVAKQSRARRQISKLRDCFVAKALLAKTEKELIRVSLCFLFAAGKHFDNKAAMKQLGWVYDGRLCTMKYVNEATTPS